MTRTDESVTSWYCTNCCSYTVWNQIILILNSTQFIIIIWLTIRVSQTSTNVGLRNIARPANLRWGKQIIYFIRGSLVCGLCALPGTMKRTRRFGKLVWCDIT